jgi:hypothetical protein
MSDSIKRRDAVTLAWDLDPVPTWATSARVIIAERGKTPIVSRAGVLSGDKARVTITLTAAETAIAGCYRVEIETLPGPVTYPSSDYDTLSIESDLDPTA